MADFVNCSGFSNGQLDALVALRGVTSAIVCILLVAFLIVMCINRSRLGLGQEKQWLKISLFVLFGMSICYLAVLSLGPVYHLLPPANAGTWCAIFGCFNQILSVLQITLFFISIRPIMTSLCSKLLCGHERKRCFNAKCMVRLWIRTTLVFAVIVVIVSLIAPFITHTYGEYGGWCWIYHTDKNCKRVVSGFLEQILLWMVFYVYIALTCMFLTLVAPILLLIIVVLKICTNTKDYKPLQPTCSKHMFREYTFQMIILVTLFLDFAHLGFKSPVHHYNLPLWLVFALFTPVIEFFIPLSFLLYICFGRKNSGISRSNLEDGNRSRDSCEDKETMALPSIKTSTLSTDYGTANEDPSWTYVCNMMGKK